MTTQRKVRKGSIYKRCARCGRTLATKSTPKRCPGCDAATGTKRNVTWSWRLDVASAGAPRKVRSGHGFTTPGEAQAAMDELRASISDERYVEKSADTFSDYLAGWLDGIRHEVSAGTWASYEGHVRNYIVPRLGHHNLQAITRGLIKQALTDLRENGRLRGEGGGLAPKTVHNVFLTLHVALEEAVRGHKIPRNPADGAHKLGKDDVDLESIDRAKTWWGDTEIETFLAHVADDDYHAMWNVFLWTGARRGEVAAMRWADVDFEAGTWTITRQWRKGRDGRPEVATLKAAKHGKSNRQRRTIALVPETVEALRRHRAEQNKMKLIHGGEYEDHDLVFCHPNGAPLHPDGISQRWERHVRESGLRRIRLHDARHSHATWALDQGMPLLQVSRRLGHASIQITADTYGHDDVESQQAALGAALKRSAQ